MDALEVSAVVLAEGHNPTILHPAFLVAQQIVPREWELAAPSISMPPAATAVYKNGISFAVDQWRLVVRDGQPASGEEFFRAFRLAKRYVETLPHVQYSAVGVNFSVLIATAEAVEALVNHFVRADALSSDGFARPTWLSLSFQHPLAGGIRTLTLAPAAPESGRSGVIVTANYHVPISSEDSLRKINETLDAAPERWKDLESVIAAQQKLVLKREN
jgi:hypothetical protein